MFYQSKLVENHWWKILMNNTCKCIFLHNTLTITKLKTLTSSFIKFNIFICLSRHFLGKLWWFFNSVPDSSTYLNSIIDKKHTHTNVCVGIFFSLIFFFGNLTHVPIHITHFEVTDLMTSGSNRMVE